MTFDPIEAAAFGDFVNQVYSMYNNGIGGLTPPQVGMPGYTVHSYIIMNDFLPWKSMNEFYGVIATKSGGAESVVVMRGTIGATEWFDNIHPGMTPFPHGNGDVEDGFNKIYSSIQIVQPGWDPNAPAVHAVAGTTMADKVAAAIASHTGTTAADVAANHSVTIVAHSLGSALATLYVMDNSKKGTLKTPLVYTFASPRVGDATFVASYNALPSVTTWRIVNKNDLVPTLPATEWGFCDVNTYVPVDDTNKVQNSLACHHAMTTYMFLLNPALWKPTGCELVGVNQQPSTTAP